MNARHLALLLTLSIILAISGCSDDRLSGPTGMAPATVGPLATSSIGPTDIVMAIDVSDSISAGELESVVSSLGGCLSDPGLVPQDGSIAVSAVVYGDTVVPILERTPVTAASLSATVIPALDSLLTDRMAGGAGALLSAALDSAGTILAVSPVMDRQVLVVGSGAADDPSAVSSACAALAAGGVMVSALGVDADAAGAQLLMDCADVGGGFYGDLADGCGDALAYMLQVDIDLEPETDELARGQTHTLEASVFRGGEMDWGVEGVSVTLSIVSGPNAPAASSVDTDSAGTATFSYLGDGGPGTDTIVASAAHPGTGTMMTDTVTVTWINTPPVCDAGGPYMVEITADTATVTLDASASSDAEGDSLRFHWSVDCDGASLDDATSAAPVLTITGGCLCVDSLVVSLEVSDGFDATTCDAAVYLDDRRPPEVEVGSPVEVWPPNHKYRTVTPEMLLMSAEDACGRPIDVSGAVVVSVSSDEPDDHNGDGRTTNDIYVDCSNTVRLRAERMGGGDGRVYTIVYRITASNGESTDVSGYVYVPHDQGGKTVGHSGGGFTAPGCIGQ